MRLVTRLPLVLLMLCLWTPVTHAQPDGFQDELVMGEWANANGLTFDANGRMYVWEKSGKIWIVEDGERLESPMLDIGDEVGDWRDYGLLGVALHPSFLSNGYVYLLYVVDRHHLMEFGTPDYDEDSNDYFDATIGRITRYTADFSDDLNSVDESTRLVLVGEDETSGFPIVHQSHGIGTILFGDDGTLLASCGDGASYSAVDTGGAIGGSYAVTALADGIITDKEDVGAYRSQLVDSLCGKVIRIDADTGDGLESNPFYDSGAPRSARSRTWVLGLRNPFRMSLRPETGSHDPEDGDPGTLYIGDVGWGQWEELDVAPVSGLNFGWPAFEGFEVHSGYWDSDVENLDADNPIFDGVDCDQEFLLFRELIQQDTLAADPSFPNPCDALEELPETLDLFLHARPAIDWNHNFFGPSRTGSYDGDDASVVRLDDVDSPVPGPNFGGSCAVGGAWYTGDSYPDEYQNKYFAADYTRTWVRCFEFDSSDAPVSVSDFVDDAGAVVMMTTHPTEGDLYYIRYGGQVRRIVYAPEGNQPPIAIAGSDVTYGDAPLTVHFDAGSSTDPDGGTLTYEWDFGDGSSTSTDENPEHTYEVAEGVPTRFDVTLTVTDGDLESSTATLIISVENTPPVVSITSPANLSVYSIDADTDYDLMADISDAEHGTAELTCEWETSLHHNEHNHPEPIIEECEPTVVVSPVGCDGQTYFYRMTLTVTDAAGLSTTDEVRIYPDCPVNEIPVAEDDDASLPLALSTLIDVLANDRDLYGALDPSTISITSSPTAGTVSVDTDTGLITYEHAGSLTTTDSFAYTVDDNVGATSDPATVSLTLFNLPPTVEIHEPAAGDRFSVGDMIELEAHATDAQDGEDGLEYAWEIQRIHGSTLETELFVSSQQLPPAYEIEDIGAKGDHVSYLILVTVTDTSGASASAQYHLLPLEPPANSAPVASFTSSVSEGEPPLSVDFDASSTTDVDDDYLWYDWDFGDGATDSGVMPSHTYDGVGSFVVTLTVTDGLGESSTETTNIDVAMHGLEGTYFDDRSLGNVVLVRTDDAIDFTWGIDSPADEVPDDDFSVRWRGQVEPEFTENYTFTVTTDDGFRLWIDGELIVDTWVDQAPTDHDGSIDLVADTKVDLVAEYYENGGGAVARLRWSSTSLPLEIIPNERLFLAPNLNDAPIAVDDFTSVIEGDHVHVDVLFNDTDSDGSLDADSIQISVDPLHGTARTEGGEIVYEHDGSSLANDSFQYVVSDDDGDVSNSATVYVVVELDVPSATEFLRGDVNGDGLVEPLADAIGFLVWAFLGGSPLACEDAADIDGNDLLEPLIDVIELLDWAFDDGPAPVEPGPYICGPDPEDDPTLDCATPSSGCE